MTGETDPGPASSNTPRQRCGTATSHLERESLDRIPHAEAINRWALEYDPRLRLVRDRVEREIFRPLSTAAAARIAGLNPSYFSTYFRAKVGMCFTDWSRHVRVERAMAILRSEACPIGDLVRRVGYTGQRAFQRAFKRHTSMTPSRFRRRYAR